MPITALLGALLLLQAPAERTLLPAATELKQSFTQVTWLRELSDGRLLVADRQDKVVKLVDLGKGTAVSVGRQGGGPGEYNTPTRLLPLGKDSTLLVDLGQQRTIVILPDGTAGDIYLTSRQLTSAPQGARVPSAVDAKGRFYFAGGGMDMSSGEPKALDSLMLMRWDPRAAHVDTLIRLRQVKANIVVRKSGKDIKSINILRSPFMPHDDWALSPDGSLLIMRTDPYRLDRRAADGAMHQGPRLAYAPVAVTDSERNGLADVPKFKPPFDGFATWLAPDGRVWVQRTTPASDSLARYDVLDQSGKLLTRVVFPARTELAGFGKGVLYMVRRDDDDLEYLGRLPLPAF